MGYRAAKTQSAVASGKIGRAKENGKVKKYEDSEHIFGATVISRAVWLE